MISSQNSRFALIHGSSGSGKSRLSRELLPLLLGLPEVQAHADNLAVVSIDIELEEDSDFPFQGKVDKRLRAAIGKEFLRRLLRRKFLKKKDQNYDESPEDLLKKSTQVI